MIRIERGTPTAEELAVIVGVLRARRADVVPAPVPPVSRWRAGGMPGGGLPRPGAGAWRNAR